jgi:hypothetical protein
MIYIIYNKFCTLQLLWYAPHWISTDKVNNFIYHFFASPSSIYWYKKWATRFNSDYWPWGAYTYSMLKLNIKPVRRSEFKWKKRGTSDPNGLIRHESKVCKNPNFFSARIRCDPFLLVLWVQPIEKRHIGSARRKSSDFCTLSIYAVGARSDPMYPFSFIWTLVYLLHLFYFIIFIHSLILNFSSNNYQVTNFNLI